MLRALGSRDLLPVELATDTAEGSGSGRGPRADSGGGGRSGGSGAPPAASKRMAGRSGPRASIAVMLPVALFVAGVAVVAPPRGGDVAAWFPVVFLEAVFAALWVPALAALVDAHRAAHGSGALDGSIRDSVRVGGPPWRQRLAAVLAEWDAAPWPWFAWLAFFAALSVAGLWIVEGGEGWILGQAVLACGSAAMFGLTRAIAVITRRAGLAQVLTTLLGLACVSTPFWANGLLEHPAVAKTRGDLIAVVLSVNPLAAVADAFEYDWIRDGAIYGRSVIGPYYPFEYPRAFVWMVAATALGGLGLAAAGAVGRIRSGRVAND